MFHFLVLSVLMACVFGTPTSRIVGGKDTTIEDHPYQVSVRVDGKHDCGGIILGNRKVLTAAHCCNYQLSRYTIQYGITKCGTDENVISVAKLTKHPGYNPAHVTSNDVCVVLLNEGIPFSNSSKLIELTKEEPSAGAKAVVTGWGYLSEEDMRNRVELPTILQEVEVNIVGRKACHQTYDSEFDKSMVCAGVREGGKDSCQNDSGGPLVSDKKLVGVVSKGHGCGRAGYPGIYANVAYLRDWIESQ